MMLPIRFSIIFYLIGAAVCGILGAQAIADQYNYLKAAGIFVVLIVTVAGTTMPVMYQVLKFANLVLRLKIVVLVGLTLAIIQICFAVLVGHFYGGTL